MKYKIAAKAKSHEMNDEIYRGEMRDYKEKNYEGLPDNKLVIYASQHNKREDLEDLYSRNKLNGKLKILVKHAILRHHEDLGLWLLLKIKNGAKPLLHVVVDTGVSSFIPVFLKQHPVDVNATDGNGNTALHLALKRDKNNPTICRILLEHGAKTDICDRNGILPLHRVSRDSNNTKMIDLLLEFNADLEAVDNHGKRPLEYAFDRKFNKQTVVCHLIRQGAKIGTKFESNGTFKCESTVPVECLLTMAKPILREVRNRSPKVSTDDMDVLDCVDLTGDVGTLVDLLKEDGDMSTLCKSNKHATIKRLLRYVELTGSHRLRQCMQERSLSIHEKCPSDVHRQNDFEKTTLAAPLQGSNHLQNEVENKSKIYEQGQAEQRVKVLHFEAVDGDEYVLTRGGGDWTNRSYVDPDAIDVVVVVSPSEDETSLQKVFTLAACHLINAGHGFPVENQLKFTHITTNNFLADPSLPHRKRSDQQFSTLCRKKCPYDNLPMHDAILHKRSTVLRKVLNCGTGDVNAEDEAGWTALHLAILLGEIEMVQMLLDRGADTASRQAHCLPAFVCAEWSGKSRLTLSPLTLSVCLNLKEIVQLLTWRNPENSLIGIGIKLSYGMKSEAALLESVCMVAKRRYKDIGARFKPTYTVHKNKGIERVCLGFSEYVDDIEKKEDIHGVCIEIINPDISPESNWVENTELTEDEEVICKAIIDFGAEKLWDQHPNLNAITAGSITSVKCPEAKSTAHIILHCSHKGYVPHESNHFPTELKCEKGAMPVAVLEGEFSLSPLSVDQENPNSSQAFSDNNGNSNVSQVVSDAKPSDDNGNSNSSQVVSGVTLSDSSASSNLSQIASGPAPSEDNQNEQEPTKCICTASPSPKTSTKRYPMEGSESLSLKVGMQICKSQSSDNTVFEGTLGAFVEMGNDKTGFITCAHLFFKNAVSGGTPPIHFSCSQQGCGADVIAPFDRFSEKFIRGVIDMEIDRHHIYEPDNVDANGRSVHWECGKVVRAVFDPTLDTGIDAAIVEIDKDREPCDGSFDDINHIHLKRAGMDWKHPPTFTSGKQVDTSYLKSVSSNERPIRCMKLGASSGLSVGILTWKHGQIRLPDSKPLGMEENSCNKYIMKEQYIITEYNKKQFFECGDSGSAVFVMKRNQQYYYPDACLGIAIGFFDKKTVVTPIGSILDIFKADGLPELALKSFK